MHKKEKINLEKGSISVYAIATVICFLIILSIIFTISSGIRKNQLNTLLKIKELYASQAKQADKIAEGIKRKLQEPVEFAYTGSLQTFTAKKAGKYQIEAAGASGSGGNSYGRTGLTAAGGKGAKIIATFELQKGDIIDIVVGGQGTCTQATTTDGTSGGGGGGTFVFKRISSVTDTKYQFTKGSINYETLLAVAGGGGSQDVGYKNVNSTGYNGQAASYKSPINYTAYSKTTNAGTSPTSVNGVMGISQFISYDAKGSFYTRNSGKAQGGYGCGGSQDDNYSYGGGWCQRQCNLSSK